MGQEQGKQDFEALAFARGMSSPLGKFTSEVKTHLDEQTYDDWLRLCNSKEVTSSEMLRDLIYLVVHRKTPAELAAEDRRGLLSVEGPNGARARIGVAA